MIFDQEIDFYSIGEDRFKIRFSYFLNYQIFKNYLFL